MSFGHILAIALAGLQVSFAPATRSTPDWSRPRELPSLVRLWQVDMVPCKQELKDGVLYALGPDRLVALDARSGARRWQSGVRCDYGASMAITDRWVLVAAGDRLHVIDGASGAIRHSVALGMRAVHLAANPLTVEASDEDPTRATSWLLSVDAASGSVLSRRPMERSVRGIDGAGRTVVVPMSHPDRVVGLRHPDLSEQWRLDGFNEIARIGGVLHVERWPREGECDFTYVPLLDPATGRLGLARPARQPCICQSKADEMPWWLQASAETRTCDTLARHDDKTGRTMWTARLAAEPTAWARSGGQLFVHSDGPRASFRGYFAALDWASGRILRAAYGLRGVAWLGAFEDRLIVTGGEGIVAVSSRSFGPPDAATVPAPEEVRRILARPADWDMVWELKLIGPDALPALIEALPTLGDSHFPIAAYVLGGAGYRSAAPVLAHRLRDRLGAQGAKAEGLQLQLLSALNQIGGPAELELIAGIFADTARPARVRAAGLSALAGIGTPAAAEVVDRVLARPRRERRQAWVPPSPAGFLQDIGKPLDEAAQNSALEREDLEEWARLGRGPSSARLPLPEGRSLVVFKHDFLGDGRDLWAAEVDAAGHPAVARFLGVRLPGDDCYHLCRISVRLEGTALEVERTDKQVEIVKVDLREVDLDTDADGLSDLVEKRLGTDSRAPDTDADGLGDAVDPNPDSAARAPEGEEQEIADAVFEQVFLFDSQPRGLVLVSSEFALDWYGRRDLTLTRSPAAAERFINESGAKRVNIFSIGPIHGNPFDRRPLAPDERDYAYSLGFSSDWIIVRKLGQHWVIRETYRGVAR